MAFFRRSGKPPVALRFRNPTFRHGRLPSGAEELKHVEVVRKHSDGSFQSFAPQGGLHPCASFHDVNLEWNPELGDDPKLKRSATNPGFVPSSTPAFSHEGRLAPGGSSSVIGQSQRSDLDKISSERSGESPPTQSSMEDEDELDIYTADKMGDKAKLIR